MGNRDAPIVPPYLAEWSRYQVVGRLGSGGMGEVLDRKSTRLNSSHRTISYAVFCLKKKRKALIHKPPRYRIRYIHDPHDVSAVKQPLPPDKQPPHIRKIYPDHRPDRSHNTHHRPSL